MVKLLKSFKYEKGYYIYMEQADNGDLQNYVDHKIKPETKNKKKRWRESKILKIFVQLALALKHIHSKK